MEGDMAGNHNLFVEKFLTIYSQSELSTAGTRGYDPQTYVDTKLDLKLTPRIYSPETRLVVLTGNAGDGKTAYIQRLEAMARDQGATFSAQTDNGCIFKMNGISYQTLYDGSQDFEGAKNDQILKTFFSDLEGPAEPQGSFTKIIAINEGKLRDFILHKKEYSWLGKQVHHYFEWDSFTPPKPLIFINLNLRSVVSDNENEPSIFDLILDRFLDKDGSLGFWEACVSEKCHCANRCYIRYNIETLRHSTLGPIVRHRLKQLFYAVLFRKIRHITVRDIRSFLSYILINKYTCRKIQEHLDSGVPIIERLYYNAAFPKEEKDRLAETMHDLDVSLTSNPKMDNFIHFHGPYDDLCMRLFISGHEEKQDQPHLKHLFENMPQGTDDDDPVRHENALFYHQSLRRKLYFESSDEEMKSSGFPIWRDFLPYKKFNRFSQVVHAREDQHFDLRNNLTLAISKSERIYNETIGSENLCLRSTSTTKASTKGFYSFPASDFKVMVKDIGFQEEFLEYTPNALYYRYVGAGANQKYPLELEIPIDLFEVLCRIREGYIPAASEVRTFFLNLEMFKRRIASKRPDKIFLTDDDSTLFEMKKDPANNLIMTKVGG